MRHAQLLNRSLLFSVCDNKYINIDSDGDSYGTEPTVFDSDADGDANSNAHSDADSGINCGTDSTTKSENAYKASA